MKLTLSLVFDAFCVGELFRSNDEDTLAFGEGCLLSVSLRLLSRSEMRENSFESFNVRVPSKLELLIII